MGVAGGRWHFYFFGAQARALTKLFDGALAALGGSTTGCSALPLPRAGAGGKASASKSKKRRSRAAAAAVAAAPSAGPLAGPAPVLAEAFGRQVASIADAAASATAAGATGPGVSGAAAAAAAALKTAGNGLFGLRSWADALTCYEAAAAFLEGEGNDDNDDGDGNDDDCDSGGGGGGGSGSGGGDESGNDDSDGGGGGGGGGGVSGGNEGAGYADLAVAIRLNASRCGSPRHSAALQALPALPARPARPALPICLAASHPSPPRTLLRPNVSPLAVPGSGFLAQVPAQAPGRTTVPSRVCLCRGERPRACVRARG